MRLVTALFAALVLLASAAIPASAAEPILSIVFSGNSWGYLKPCPS
jgi:opacity protein-like surface antigen